VPKPSGPEATDGKCDLTAAPRRESLVAQREMFLSGENHRDFEFTANLAQVKKLRLTFGFQILPMSG
jgi:hypothetical protein